MGRKRRLISNSKFKNKFSKLRNKLLGIEESTTLSLDDLEYDYQSILDKEDSPAT